MNLPIEIVKVKEIRNNLDDFSDDYRDELYTILANATNRTLIASIIQTLRIAQDEFPGFPIVYHELIKNNTVSHNTKPFLYILDIFGVDDVGTYVTGYIINGSFGVGDLLLLKKADGRDIPTSCKEISEHPSLISRVLLDELSMGEVAQGDCLIIR